MNSNGTAILEAPVSTVPVPGVWDVDEATYHADTTALTNSMLKCFRQSIPRFHGMYVTGEIEKPAQTESMIVGSALHALLLEGEQVYNARFAVGPTGDKRTTAVKEAWKIFEAELDGRLALTQAQEDLVFEMVRGVHSNFMAMDLLGHKGKAEHTICWDETRDDAFRCKARLDWLSSGQTIAIDIKTIDDSSPESWVKAVINYGYHRQQHFYQLGCNAVHRVVPEFYFIAVSKQQPSECVVYKLNDDFLKLARYEIDEAFEELAMCRSENRWDGRYNSAIYTAEAPKWAMNPFR